MLTSSKLLTLAVTLLGHFEVVEIGKLVETAPVPDAPGPPNFSFLEHFNLLYRYGAIANLVYLIALPYVWFAGLWHNSGLYKVYRIIKCAILAFYRKIVVTKKSVYLLYAVAFVIMGQGIGNFIVRTLIHIVPRL